MKSIIKIFILLLLGLPAPAQDSDKKAEQEAFDSVTEAIRSNQINKLSNHFAANVECDILGQSNVYSKAQTIQVVKDFFVQNKVKSFNVLHQSGKNQVKFIIGSYTAITGKTYRITCFIKQEGSNFRIQQIRIENDSKTAMQD